MVVVCSNVAIVLVYEVNGSLAFVYIDVACSDFIHLLF